MDELIKEINTITEWYRGQPDHITSSRKNIDALLKARRMLSANMVKFAEVVSFAREARDAAVFARKKAYSTKVLERRSEGLTFAESEHKATIETETHREIERGAEKSYENAKLIYQSVGDVLNAIAGDLKILQYEYEKINYQDGK